MLPRGRMLGFTMVEMLTALTLAAIMVAGVAAMTNTMLEDTRAQQAAFYQAQLAAAATQLIEQNYQALAAQATASTPVVAKLNGSAYQLSTYMSAAMNAVNAYGQTPCLLIYGTATPGALQGLLVTERGTTIKDAELGFIAANAGAGGGSIQAANNPGGAANGAFGSWTVAAPNPAGASCSGTKTGVGHVASLIYYNGTQAQNADYLYRIAVPGDPGVNTMQVPIVLAQQSDYTACSQTGSISADATGNVLNCSGGMWTPQASFHWREAVPDYASLASVSQPQDGDVRMTMLTRRAYVYNALTSPASWQALAVDESGNLALGNTAAVGGSCTNPAGTTLVTTDSTGRVLSCQPNPNGPPTTWWQTQSEVVPGMQVMGCQLIMSSAGAADYPSCAPQSGGYSVYPYAYNSTNGTYSYTYKQPMQLAKPGIIVAASWAHMNDGVCGSKSGNQAQISQDVDILDSNNNDIAHTESQSPTLIDDSGGINNALAQAGSAGNYTVVVTTNWATYAVIGTPWTSSFCGEGGGTIPNTPVAAGWVVNTYY